MSAKTVMSQYSDQFALFWLARTEQERKYLTVGGALLAVALVYGVLVGPSLAGIKELNEKLPLQRIEAAQIQALAQEAAELARAPAPQVTPMTREALLASLAARSITPQSLIVTGEFAKLQLNGVAFASLSSWLDAQRHESRILVDDLAVTAGTPAGQVDALLTLRQNTGDGAK